MCVSIAFVGEPQTSRRRLKHWGRPGPPGAGGQCRWKGQSEARKLAVRARKHRVVLDWSGVTNGNGWERVVPANAVRAACVVAVRDCQADPQAHQDAPRDAAADGRGAAAAAVAVDLAAAFATTDGRGAAVVDLAVST